MELGPRSEQEIRAGLEQEVDAERWTSLDRSLRAISDEGGGVADLRPGGNGEDPELRRLILGRAAKLERLGLAEQVGPAQWTLKPSLESALRDLGIRGDIIKTMHRAVSAADCEPDVAGFALHGDEANEPVLGRLVERGLHDELKGSAYAIIEGIDGRTHHLVFSDLEMTGDAKPGAIVETRTYNDASGRKRVSLAIRSDLTVNVQVSAPGATWIDRQLLAKELRSAAAASARGPGGNGPPDRSTRRTLLAARPSNGTAASAEFYENVRRSATGDRRAFQFSASIDFYSRLRTIDGASDGPPA